MLPIHILVHSGLNPVAAPVAIGRNPHKVERSPCPPARRPACCPVESNAPWPIATARRRSYSVSASSSCSTSGCWIGGKRISCWTRSGRGSTSCAKMTCDLVLLHLSVAPLRGRWRLPACGSSPCSQTGRSSACRACTRASLSRPSSTRFCYISAWLLLSGDPFTTGKAPLRLVQRRLRSCAMDRSLLAPSL